MKQIQFSAINQSDIPQICALEKECCPTPWDEKQFRLALQDKVFSIFGAKSGKTILGYIAVYKSGAGADGLRGGEMEVLNLAVRPEYRRRGLGRRLLSIMLQATAKMGIVRAVLEVRVSNIPAIELYRSLGFIQVGRRPDYYQDTNEDALIMAREITPDNSAETK